MVIQAQEDRGNWYCIKFDVPKNKNITALEFSRKMNSFLEQISEFNHSIVSGIDDTYTVASYIEDFESGSIKWWLVDKLNKVDDKAIEKFVASPLKTTIAEILKFSKKKAIECLNEEGYSRLPSNERKMKIINPIIEKINSKQEELNRNVLSPKISINENRLLKSLSNMSKISEELEEKISFIDDYNNQKNQIIISKNFGNLYDCIDSDNKTQEEKLLQSENEITDFYTLLTPTSKEDCKWEFDDGGNKIKCKMEDVEFFNKYCKNEEKLGGKEKLKIKMKIQTFLEGNKIKKEYTILKVIEKLQDRDLFNYREDENS